MTSLLRSVKTTLGHIARVDRVIVAPERIRSGTPYVGLEHIGSDFGELTPTIVESGELRSAKFIFSRGHILFGKLRPYLHKVARPDFEGVCSTDIIPILPSPEVDRGYLFHLLRSPAVIGFATMRSVGVNLPRISPAMLLSIPIRLPPIAEQRRTAAMLDQADRIRRSQRHMRGSLEEFLNASFLDMFGDPIKNDRKWGLHRASRAISSIEAGSSVGGDARAREQNEWAVLKISAVTSGAYRPSECKVVGARPDRVVVPTKGDLLFSRANTRELVGATCLVDRTEPRLFLPDKLWRVTPNASLADAAYLRYLLAHRQFREKLTAQATGTSGSMLNVSQEKLLRMELPLPPLGLQRRFSAIVWKTIETREKMKDAAEQADRLLESIMRRVFESAA